MNAVLSAHDLAVGYRAGRQPPRRVADGISVSLRAGELVCLIGPNGAGKSTLVRTLAGMQPPLAGAVRLLGDDLHRLSARDLARRLSVVLTDRVSIGALTAFELVALGRHPYTDWAGRLSTQDEAAVWWSLDAVGAAALAARDLSELSDGERQKVLIARALAQEPAVMLLDEPTAFLDLPRRAEIVQLLRRLAQETGRAVLLSTHDLDLALRAADQLWLLPGGGPLRAGAPEDLVLNGAFEAVFRGAGVTFDAFSGAFHTATQPSGVIGLRGEGLAALWTARALERAGFCVEKTASAAPLIEVLAGEAGGAARWRLAAHHTTRTFSSLYDLIAALKPPAHGDH
jgi:iron complex transport system ATP-binding protein